MVKKLFTSKKGAKMLRKAVDAKAGFTPIVRGYSTNLGMFVSRCHAWLVSVLSCPCHKAQRQGNSKATGVRSGRLHQPRNEKLLVIFDLIPTIQLHLLNLRLHVFYHDNYKMKEQHDAAARPVQILDCLH